MRRNRSPHGGVLRGAPRFLGPLAILAILASVTIAFETRATADPAQARAAALSWVRGAGAEDCPSGATISAEVERVLGGPRLTSLSQADLVIEGRVAKTDDGFETVLTLASRSGAMLGTRKLGSKGSSCNAITPEVGLVIALMIDPEAAMRPTPTAPPAVIAPPPTISEAPSPIDASPFVLPGSGDPIGASLPPSATPPPVHVSSVVCAPPAPSAESARPWRAQLSVGPVVSAGLVPSAGLGVRGRIAITPPRLFPLEIGGEIFAPVRVAVAGRGVDVELAQAFVRACPLSPSVGRFAFSGCLGLDFGSVRGAGFGFDVNHAAEMPVVAAALGGRAGAHLGSIVSASFGADLAIPFFRGRFYYDATDGTAREAFLTAPIAGTFDLSIGLSLP